MFNYGSRNIPKPAKVATAPQKFAIVMHLHVSTLARLVNNTSSAAALASNQNLKSARSSDKRHAKKNWENEENIRSTAHRILENSRPDAFSVSDVDETRPMGMNMEMPISCKISRE